MSVLTRIAAAQDALKAALASRPALADVHLDIGFPIENGGGPYDEHIWISGEIPDWKQEWEVTGLGAQAKEETFSLSVIVRVFLEGATYVVSRDRAIALVGEIEQEMRDDWTVGSSVFDMSVKGGILHESVHEKAREVIVILDLGVTAFLV